MQALWLYIKHNQLQDGHEREYINCNRYFRQVGWGAIPTPSRLSAPACPVLHSPLGPVPGHIPHTGPGMISSSCALRGILGTLSRSSAVAGSVSPRFP